MKKLKEFASGEVLTAEDVNEYLNPSVPDAAAVIDTGWVLLQLVNGWTVVSGFAPAFRRVGMQVFLRGRCEGPGASIFATLPADCWPGHTFRTPVQNVSGGIAPIILQIASNGDMSGRVDATSAPVSLDLAGVSFLAD